MHYDYDYDNDKKQDTKSVLKSYSKHKSCTGFVPTKLILISTAMGILLQEGTNFKLVSCWSIILQFHDLIKKN